jgi:hypothetical protein
MKRLTAFATGAILATSLFAADPQWIEVTKAGADGETTVYADIASVKHVEGKTLVWFLTTGGGGDKYPYYTSKYPLGTTYKSSVVLQSFDCAKGRSASLQASYYSEDNMSGEHLGSLTTPDKDISFSYPTPGTVGSGQLDYVCAYLAPKKRK